MNARNTNTYTTQPPCRAVRKSSVYGLNSQATTRPTSPTPVTNSIAHTGVLLLPNVRLNTGGSRPDRAMAFTCLPAMYMKPVQLAKDGAILNATPYLLLMPSTAPKPGLSGKSFPTSKNAPTSPGACPATVTSSHRESRHMMHMTVIMARGMFTLAFCTSSQVEVSRSMPTKNQPGRRMAKKNMRMSPEKPLGAFSKAYLSKSRCLMDPSRKISRLVMVSSVHRDMKFQKAMPPLMWKRIIAE
mmetsp:Transcript_15107/g.33319  ORF Transcript_15107/g.33319 Transcript_15107/m.33319 type:complete len:243 (-) Transcript_15107:295-1023(-)